MKQYWQLRELVLNTMAIVYPRVDDFITEAKCAIMDMVSNQIISSFLQRYRDFDSKRSPDEFEGS